MEILTAAEMAAVDRGTVEAGVSIVRLMEAAGDAVARFCLRQYPAAKRVVALCGKGNNGGDGLVAARVLAAAGVEVRVVLLGRTDDVKGPAAVALGRLQTETAQVEVREALDERGLQEAWGWALSHPTAGGQPRLTWGTRSSGGIDLVLDAVVGTGFKPPLRGLALAMREMVARCGVPVVAVDVPSGWDADSLEQTAVGAFRADAVVTFTRPKLAHVFGCLTGGVWGPVVVAGIGSPDEVIDSVCSSPTLDDATVIDGAPRLHWAGAAKALAEAPRAVNANKGKYGHVLVVGGSYGTAGAPSMASVAAMRAGAGLVTAAVPECVASTVAGIAPELMVRPIKQGAGPRARGPEDQDGGLPLELLEGDAPAKLLKGITVLAVGPGLGQEGTTPEFVRRFVAKRVPGKDGRPLPVVIDADGLNAFDGKAEQLDGAGRVVVLTPHPGEMARLAGMTVAEVEKDRIGLARRFATEHKVTLVLKGWRTLVAHPDGRVGVNTTGNPGMAKGGSGDILTGIVAAMLAQFAGTGEAEDVAKAVEAAVFLHGLAGDFAARKMDEHTVLAMDTVGCLSEAFRYRVRDEDGLTWICGLR